MADEPRPDDTPVDDASPAALIDVARYVYSYMTSRFGEPADVAAPHRITKATADAMRFWFRSLESLTCLILFVLALAIASPPRKSGSAPKPKQQEFADDERRAGDAEWDIEPPPSPTAELNAPLDPDNPASWPVNFKFWRLNHDKPDVTIDLNDPSTFVVLYAPKAATEVTESTGEFAGLQCLAAALRMRAIFPALDGRKAYARNLAKLLETGNREFSFQPPHRSRQESVRRGPSHPPQFSPCQGAVERALRRCREQADSYWPSDFFDGASDTS